MDQLKLKLQEYYQQYQKLEKQPSGKAAEGEEDTVQELENDILTQFGLPVSKRFVQILHDFVNHSVVNDQLLDYVSKKLRTAARKYLLSPVMSDQELLTQARDQKRSPYDVLPELGYPAHEYAIFLVGELLYRRNMAPQDILDELKNVQKHKSWEDLAVLSKMHNYSTHELYGKLKKLQVRFVDDFVQHLHRQEVAKPQNKRLTPAEEGYKPNYKTISKIQVEDIVFDDNTTPSLFGKIRNGRSYSRITIGLEFSELNQLLMSGGELGVEISNAIKKRLANRAAEKPLVIDIKAEFGEALKLDNCYLEVYKPQHKEGGKWMEDKDAFYFVDKILSKKEFEKKAKEEEVKTKIQECLELIGGSYVYYQRLRRLGITEEEAKLRAGLQDELLFKLSSYLNKLKD
ncbi:hypothetical protein EGT74_25075 [Chitinophaga lutea]|uniref:Uncharacterized protein n=1 Tax=Chitinophaga lutea TaxID=2488634 RepID=A0A3N4PPF5_9BACT|nr:hypothetical protein [Chitinophaga lutea]RPE05650.1 hypothetical protein EGT74_25075 [Chitinophaga lutea]